MEQFNNTLRDRKLIIINYFSKVYYIYNSFLNFFSLSKCFVISFGTLNKKFSNGLQNISIEYQSLYFIILFLFLTYILDYRLFVLKKIFKKNLCNNSGEKCREFTRNSGLDIVSKGYSNKHLIYNSTKFIAIQLNSYILFDFDVKVFFSLS
jgi:hypothetical protein